MNRYLIVLCVLTLFGCVTMGKEITEEQLAGFKKGETTIDQVVANLGSPTSSSVSSATGQRTISYMFAHAQARPASFIPFIGPLVGGTDSRSTWVVFMFGMDGKLLTYYASQSQLGMGTGAAAGRYQQQTPDQPHEAPVKP